MKTSYEDLEKRVKELEKMKFDYITSMEKYEVLFNQNPDAVVIIDPSNESIIEFNDQLCKQLGYTREELSNLKISDIEALETIDDTKHRIQSIIENGSARFETKHRSKSGEIIDVLVIAQYIKIIHNGIYHCIWRDITANKKSEIEKNQSLLLLQNLAEQVPGVIYQYRYHPDGRNYFPFASENINNVYEVTPDEVKLDASKVFSRLHSEDYKSVMDKIIYSFETLEIWEDDYRVILPERGERWLRGIAKPEKLSDGSVLWHGYISDITEKKYSEEKIRKSGEKLKTYLNSSPLGIFVADKYGNYIDTNLAASEITGYSQDELLKMSIKDILNPIDYQKAMLHFNKVIDTGYSDGIMMGIKKNGENYWFSVVATIIDDNQFIAYTKDETQKIISDRKLKESEAQLDNALKMAKMGCWVFDFRSGIFTFSDNFYKLLDTNFEEMGGYSMTIQEYQSKFIHLDDPNIVEKEAYKSINSDEESHESYVETRILIPNGKIKNVAIRTFTEKDENGKTFRIYGVNQDITLIKETERELKKLNEKYESFISHSNEAVYCLEFDEPIDLRLPLEDQVDNIYKYGYIGHCNLAIAKMYGLNTVDEFLKKRLIEIHGGNDNEINRETFKRFLLNNFKSENLETKEIDRKGNSVYFLNNDTGIVENSKLLRIWGITRDITDKKRSEIELIKAKEKAEESDRLKSAFLCNVSHEIRTPLNAIVGFSALLSDEDLTHEERISFNNIIKSRSNDLLNIINDILDLSQIEANQIKINKTEGKISELINEIYKTFNLKRDIENKSEVELLINENIDSEYDLVRTDFHRVKQIISNFLTNAFKFTKNGTIKIGSKIIKDNIIFYVSDTGIGISSENLPKIFERFRQIEYSEKRNYGGNGLGLSISKGLANLLGGNIWAESELNVGSTFYFSIPYETSNSTNKLLINEEVIKRKDKKYKILIIEDDQYNLFYLEKVINSFGYHSLSAKNGSTALNLFKQNKDIDLILLDIQLPDISGLELLQHFKKDNYDIPVIAQTAFAMEEDKVRILESGCDDYISKPIMRDVLQRKIKEFLE